MREYRSCETKKKETVKIVCNMCGKEIEIKNGIPGEDVLSVEKQWGYFSGKDGENHHFDLCEACYDRLTETFKLPVEREQETEC